MKLTVERVCKTCMHAQWSRNPETGRVRPSDPGQCRVPFELPPIPVGVFLRMSRRDIWWSGVTECPTWSKKQ